MEQLGDKLVTCPCCGSDACYESEFMTANGLVKTWLCMTCGFTTNTTMTEDSESLKQTLELTAEFIKDLRQNHNGLAWFPTAITLPNKGMVFPEPIKNTNDWGWTVVKAIPILEEDQHKYPDATNPGVNYKFKMDMKNMKRYGKLEFMDAAEELGMFSKLIKDAN
tara:strand:+ start:367 stop:861 length:495 start_codon:yes stop_codon:yes gene_type:complete